MPSHTPGRAPGLVFAFCFFREGLRWWWRCCWWWWRNCSGTKTYPSPPPPAVLEPPSLFWFRDRIVLVIPCPTCPVVRVSQSGIARQRTATEMMVQGGKPCARRQTTARIYPFFVAEMTPCYDRNTNLVFELCSVYMQGSYVCTCMLSRNRCID